MREWTADDLPVMVELFGDPQVDRWTPLRSPFDLAAAHSYLALGELNQALDAADADHTLRDPA
ncbi:hypothetical protein ACU635_35200 [[Actinomadura] parvosata]|uniref:hypothetical protein n=1 Tax=[Actinomadura] parvosata TaxID=1955412 RepID=UPI00406CF65A